MDFTGTALWIIICFMVLWLIMLVTSIRSLVKRRDISLPVKIFWGFVISLAPIVGLIIYILFGRGTARAK